MGSSRSRISGLAMSSFASSTRISQPPESFDSDCSHFSGPEPEPGQGRAQLRVGREAARALELVVQGVVALGERIRHVAGRARDLLLGRAQPPLDRVQMRERRLGLGHHGALGDRAHLLAQVADPRAALQEDVARVGGVLARQDAQQSGLAGAVAPDQADPVARAHVEARALEERAAAERFREVLQPEHGRRSVPT